MQSAEAAAPAAGSGITGARPRLVAATAASVAALDWLTKVAAAVRLDDAPVELGSAITLRLGHNPGVAFGLGDQLPSWLLLALTSALTAGFALAALRGAFPSPAAAGLVVGGAVGNLVDRMIGGTVVDFLDIGSWPTFNLADVAITSGAVLLVIASLRAAPPETDT